ncbi:K02A2.6-like, partial [Cordylochernes scorpioides]
MERKVESNFQNGKCKHCGKQHKELCRFKEAICFKCNKKGHIASICWSSRRNLRQHQNQPGNIHQIGDQEEEEEYVQKIISVTIPEYKINFASSDPPYLMELKVEGNFIKFEMDMGSGLTLISEKDFKNSLQHLNLEKASIIVRTYDGTVVPILGKINVKVECQDITYKLRALVVKGEKRALMGREWINRLKLGCFAVKHMPVKITIEKILKENQALFVETTEPIKGFTFSVNMCDVNPIFHKARPVPFAIRPAVTEALDKMVAKGYLCEVASSKWATPVVVVPKKNKEIRICCDFKVTLNKYLDTAAYPLPTQQYLFSTLAKGKYFSKLDLRNAYLQLEVDPGTRPLLTINTHKGLFRFKRMPFGLANAPSYFQSVMDRVLTGIGGVICYIDDVLIATASIEEHLALLKTIFARLAKYNIKLKKEKCLFLQKEIEYLGHLVTEEGIRPLDHKVQAIQKAKTPTNISELRSFLGLVNFYGKFIPNLPELLKPLHELLHKKRPWVWTKECGEAIDKCKNSITSERVLVPYDATLPLCLATDASQIGVGAVLSHIIEGQERPIMFASRTLSEAEQNYSQIEKEALAIIYGVTKFHQFIYGRKFILITDHKPLVTILGSRSGIPTLSTSRLQRWALILSAYSYDIKFRRTQDHGNADLLSSFPVGCEEIPRLNNVYALSYVEELPITAEEIATETEKDEVLSLAKFYTQQGWPEKVADHLRPYFQRKLELTVDGECLVWGMRVVIPPSLRIKMLNCLHETHSGMNKMKAVAILTILPEDYNYFCTAWESTGKDEKTIENLISRLTTEEIRRNRQSQPEDRVAMNATKQKNNSKPAAKVNKEQCRICKKFNHKEKDCYFRNKEKQPPIAFIAEQREEYDKRSSVTFIVDSGSTCHMINEEKLLDHQKKCDVNINVAKKEEVMRAKTSGQFKGRQCNLNEVIFVPELSKNLLSVTSIVNNGGEVNFKGDKVTILKDGKKVLEGDQLENGLWAVNIEQHFSKKNDSNLTLPSENKTQEWHRKLGHIGMQNLRKLESLVDGMELNKLEKQENDVCEICIMAKQTRNSFGNERSRATRPWEIVHTDLCGPIEPLTHDNKKYIMTFLDDYTHFCYVYLLSNKYEAKEYIKEYVNEVERFLNAKVSKLRCDNGGEYANTQVKEWCKMKGIILDFTIPNTPQLNGKAERLNRTLIEKTRALLLDSKLNKEMWGEATRVAAYLINRSPSNTVQTTPAQMWFGRKPNLSNVKLFGSEVYVKKLGNLKKLDSKSEKYSLIGYSGNGYRLWDMQKRRIIIARDVVFTGKLTNEMTSVIQPRYREDLDSEIEESQDTKMELDTHDKPQNSTNSKYMLRNRENINRPERLKDYEVLNSVSEEIGLLTYNEAVTGVDKENWVKAIQEEKDSLKKNETWDFVNTEEVKGKKILSSRWIFKIKDGGHYKARLVARGNEQKGLDFDETFSPVVSTISLRMLLSLSVKKNLKFKTFDVKTAFLYGYLDEEIFMYLPEGYEDNKICRLKKALYGLRQAPSKWNKRFEAFLKTKGLVKSKLENCIFKNQNGSLILALYVDDGMLFGSDEKEMDNLLVELAQEFEIRISNNPEMFVGMNIMNKDEGLILSQHDYIECVLKKYNMLDAKPVTTPIVGAVKIDPILENKSEGNFPYREAVGSLLYLANKTRPDVAYAVGYEGRSMHEPTNQDIQNVKRTMRYLKQTKTFGLHYSKQDEDMELNAYCDSDFAGDMKTRKSTSGYTILFGKGPISWSSRKQPIVALSTTEAEYIAAAECVKELIYMKALIEELTNETILAKLNIDNQSAMTLMKTGQMNRKTKHIDVRYHFLKDQIRENVDVQFCPTQDQVADILTKTLPKETFEKHRSSLLQISCQQSQDGPNKGKWQPWRWSTRPWQRIHIDFANKENINLLIVVDSHSKWIEAIPMRETTTRKTIEQLRRLFSSYGLPEELVSDNGPQFTGSEMKGFLEGNGIKQTLIPAYHPQSNGLAERAVRTIKTALDKNKRKIGDTHTHTIQDTLSKVLLAYRSTPHVTTGKTPSELFIGRALRTRVSLIHPSLASRVRDQQARQMKYDRRTHLEEFQIDDLVWCKNFRGGDKWIPGKIVGKKGTRVYIILIHGQVKAYHRDQIRKRWRNGEEDESGDGERQPEHSRGAGPSAIISEVVRDRGYMESLSPGLTSQRSDQDSEVQSDTDDGKSLEPLRSLDPEALKEKGPVLRRNPPRARRPPITIIFKANGLLDIVNGKSLFEDLKYETGKDKWSLKDAKAQKYIMLTIEKNVLTHILNCKTSKEMYEKLVAIYQREDEQLKCKLLQEFHGFKFDKNTDMATNISRMQNLVFKLNNVKQEIEESFVISKILSILPDYFNYFSTAWDSTPKSEKTLTNLISRLSLEETKQKVKPEEGIAMSATKVKQCFNCKKSGHLAKYCRLNKKWCTICKKTNHTQDQCFFKKSQNKFQEYIPCRICKKTNHKEKDCFFRNKNEEKLSFFAGETLRCKNEELLEFIVDSGSTSHMINSKRFLLDEVDCNSKISIAKKEETLIAKSVGKIQGKKCDLKEVMFVPNLTNNLLSVSAITRNKGKVVFEDEKVFVVKNGKKVLEGEKQENGLYTINIETENPEIEESHLTATRNEEMLKWHRKMGHISFSSLKQLKSMVNGINIEKISQDGICETCIKAKQVRKPFNSIRTKSKRPLEIIHTDVCGPLDPTTHDNKNYFLTFLDDYTHFCHVYLLQNRYEVKGYLKEFITEAENQINLNVSKIRCDNSGEYVNEDIKSWCKAKGIIMDLTIPHSPQLNGKAERLNRTLMEKTRALLIDSGVEKYMWGEAVRVSAYLLNRSPTQELEKTPAELWFNKRPNLSNLQLFGCEAYVKTLKHIKKLEDRSKKYTFIGYAPNGYRLWDEQSKQIFTARDVIFLDKGCINKEEKIPIVEPEEESEDQLELNEEPSLPEVSEDKEDIPTKPSTSKYNLRPRSSLQTPSRYEDFYLERDGTTESALLTYSEAISEKSLAKNEVWEIVKENEASNKNILTSKWLFKVKEDGRYKARLVVRGFEQEAGIDYDETFSPVISTVSLRIYFALMAKRRFVSKTFDIKTAFLYGFLDEEIYVQLPEGYKGNICRLRKGLYGLKQAPLKWNERLKTFLKSQDFIQLKSEPCLFKTNKGNMYLAIYVDDGILMGDNEEELNNILEKLSQEFEVKINNDPRTFLGINLCFEEKNKILLSQENYAKSVLERYNMQNSKPVPTPITDVAKEVDKNLEISNDNKFPYRQAIGSLLYLTNKTRPDMTFATNFESRSMHDPTTQNIINIKRTLRYLNHTTNLGISYDGEMPFELNVYCDSDFAGDIKTRKSTTGYVVYLCGGPISWCSRKQPKRAELQNMENIKPPAEFVPYNGEKKWETWREAFEIFSIAADLESMPLVRQRAILKHILNEKTVSIYKTFRVTENEAYPSIKEMLDMFSKHFKPFKNIIQIRNKFFTSVQKEGQGITEFVRELKQLAQECEFEELAESLIRDRFIIGMIDQEVKRKLLEDPQLTLPKAISVATIAESVCVQIASWEEKQAMIEKINKNTWEKNRSRVEKAKAGPSIASTRNECKWCGQQHTYGNCPAYRKTCNACGKLNHFAAVCRTRRIRNLIAENEGDESFEGGINVNKVLVKTVRSDKWSAVISINGNKTSVHLDTGAQINVLPQKVISLWPAKPIIKPTSLKAYAYGHSELPIVGKCEVLCQYGEKKSLCEFIIADVDAQTLITGDTCEKLEILKRINPINSHQMILHDQTKKILEQFHEVFQGVGVINSECKMYTKPEYPPVRALPRRIPASLGNEVQSELEKMVKQGIITKIYHETEWSHPMVVVKKKSGQIRICLDPRKLNQALVRRHFQTPAPSELLHQIPKADYYTVLDVKSAYWHVPIANECRDLLVMATPFGKFRYNRLPFGLNISAQIFVEMMTNIFKNSFRNVTYVDDLLIYADSIEEHNEKLKGILEIARRNNIKFDLTKAQICKKEVSFLGHMISKNGIDPEPNKVDKVINLKKPEDKKSLQRVMGLYNYLGKFIPNLAASTSNIRGILKKNVVWHWGPRQDIEFHHIKECVRNAPSLGHYDKTKTLVLQCDASKDAMGAALLQENRPLAFASASFNDSQKQYSQIEKELLSIYYGCKKFEYLLLGHTFIIQTDHQPLLPLIQKPLTDISPRLQRIVMKLFAFDFKLQYRPGKCLILADTLSRDTHPIDELPTPFLEDRRMVKLISANISDEKLITLQKDTREDTTLLKIIHHVIEGWPISKKDVDEDVKPYYDFRHRIYLWNELLCVGSAIVVPGTQRNYMLELLHKSHQGISAIQGLARESLFWPGMSMDIAERVKSCDICQKYQKSKTRETLRSFPIPDYPWQTVSMDIFYIERKPHLLIVDRFSGYPEVYALNPPTATNVRNKLRETFARFGIPETIMSDNGPPFHSEIMTDFCTKWGIRQIFSSPHLHRSNGLAERNIQTIKTLLNKCKDQGSDAYLALLTYRNTPKNDLPSPAQLCLSRSLRCLIPRITPLYGPCKTNQRHIENAKKRRQISMKRYYDRSSKIYPKVSVGEEAWCQLSPKQAWTPVKITAHGNSPQSFKVETPSGREFLRNQQFLRPKNGPSGKGESPSLGTSFSGESSPVAADSSSWERTTEEEPVPGPSTTPIQQQPRDGMAVPSENSSVMPRFSRFGRELKKPQRL